MGFFSNLPPEPNPSSKIEQVVSWCSQLLRDLYRVPNGSFLTTVKESWLPASRVLTAGQNITIKDGGPGGNLTISGNSQGASTTASFVTVNTEPGLPQSRKLTAGANITITDGGPLGAITIASLGGGSVVTKTLQTFIAAGTSVTSGTTTTGSVLNETTTRGGLITMKLTNPVSPGAGLPPYFNVYTSGDNVNFKLYTTVVGDLVSNSVNQWSIVMTQDVMYCRVDCVGNSSANVTAEAFMQELTTG